MNCHSDILDFDPLCDGGNHEVTTIVRIGRAGKTNNVSRDL